MSPVCPPSVWTCRCYSCCHNPVISVTETPTHHPPLFAALSITSLLSPPPPNQQCLPSFSLILTLNCLRVSHLIKHPLPNHLSLLHQSRCEYAHSRQPRSASRFQFHQSKMCVLPAFEQCKHHTNTAWGLRPFCTDRFLTFSAVCLFGSCCGCHGSQM